MVLAFTLTFEFYMPAVFGEVDMDTNCVSDWPSHSSYAMIMLIVALLLQPELTVFTGLAINCVKSLVLHYRPPPHRTPFVALLTLWLGFAWAGAIQAPYGAFPPPP